MTFLQFVWKLKQGKVHFKDLLIVLIDKANLIKV